MQVRPVKHYSDPTFPTRSILDERPELLRLVPKRWQRNPAVLTAVAGLCMLMAGARSAEASKPVPRVAPIFMHGEGTGSFGCSAITSPVFLSEAEAYKVIIDEAKKSGVDFITNPKVTRSLFVPATNRYDFAGNSAFGEKTSHKPLSMDGTVAKLKISFEYVSDADFEKWNMQPSMGTLGSRDPLEAATALRKSLLKTKSGGAYAIFYDPCCAHEDAEKEFGSDYKIKRDQEFEQIMDKEKSLTEKQSSKLYQEYFGKLDADALHVSREQLRAQVRDFIKWLKAEGVI